MKERKALMDVKSPLSIRVQVNLFDVDRSGYYYKPVGESVENQALMVTIYE
ncbi:MAG: hypothetical protein O2829_09265 [Bacteroidetes bacterium]|nr:hypothetical protein [Bacteroidota bacterium]MDA1269263.1 hypothetical protein [Bacteroidota bacterium]